MALRQFPRWHPWTLCALRTGLRLGELLALQWGDIDWNGGFLTVQRNIGRGGLTSPKSHERRRVDMAAGEFELQFLAVTKGHPIEDDVAQTRNRNLT